MSAPCRSPTGCCSTRRSGPRSSCTAPCTSCCASATSTQSRASGSTSRTRQGFTSRRNTPIAGGVRFDVTDERLVRTMLFSKQKTQLVSAQEALPGRSTRPFSVPQRHFVLDTPLEPPYADGLETAYFALGCFWGAERKFWETEGVFTTAAG